MNPVHEELEQELNRQNNLMTSLLAQVPGVVFQYRLWPDGHAAFPFSSPGMKEIYELSPGEVREDASAVFSRIHPEDRDPVVKSILVSARDLTPYHKEFRVILPGAGLRWRQCDSKPERLSDGSTIWHGIITDITERKLAEEQLQEKTREISHLYESAIDLLGVGDTGGRLLQVNKEWESVFGYSLEELKGMIFLDLVHPDDRESTLEAFKKLVSVEHNQKHINRIRCKDGRYRWIEWNTRSDGKKVYSAARDITDSMQKDHELLEAKNRAEESDRLKSAFLQNISHEVRTPMNAIVGFAEMLQDPDLTEKERNEFVNIIIGSSRQLLNIVSDILSISTLEACQEKPLKSEVDLNALLEKLHSVFESQARNKNLSLTYAEGLPSGQARILSDEPKILRIMTNLLGNALKFTHEGSVLFGYRHRGDRIEFFVKDTGIGIDPGMHDTIFERFRQGEMDISRKYGGTGLGLSIAKGLAGLIGGTIQVKSEPGKGSLFTLSLPWEPVVPASKAAAPAYKPAKEHVILIAEDEELNYILIERVLKALPVRLIRARNGEEAVKLCESDPEISLVLMDIKMPRMDGYTAAGLIRKSRSDMVIIAQTAFALDQELAPYRELFDDFIAKPVRLEQFRGIVKRYLD